MAADNQERDRKSLTFTQAEGLEPIPEPLKLGELSREALGLLWREFHNSLNATARRPKYVGSPPALGHRWLPILEDWHVEVLHLPTD
jgi:hypothetical protein